MLVKAATGDAYIRRLAGIASIKLMTCMWRPTGYYLDIYGLIFNCISVTNSKLIKNITCYIGICVQIDVTLCHTVFALCTSTVPINRAEYFRYHTGWRFCWIFCSIEYDFYLINEWMRCILMQGPTQPMGLRTYYISEQGPTETRKARLLMFLWFQQFFVWMYNKCHYFGQVEYNPWKLWMHVCR